jgi:hypothetical protein
MELAQKFKVVAAIKGIARLPCMEVDKPYPIKRAFKKFKCQASSSSLCLVSMMENEESVY